MYGRQLITTNSILPTRVSADGSALYKAGGVTLDWANSVSAPGSDQNLPDGSLIKSGNKFLRYGQVICRITGTADTVTIGGSPTGGTFTLTVQTDYPTPGQPAQTTAGIAYNAAASAVQTALAALTNVGSNVSVSGSAGGPYTITFGDELGTVVVTGSAASLTGGTPTLTVGSSLGAGNTQGYYGPFDPSASDGRQTLTRGQCYIVDETVLQNADGLTGFVQNDQFGAIEGGLVWLDRIIQAGAGTHSLAAGPTFSELVAAFPMLRFVES